jgi:CDP-glycerol glycerophosphotransferase (TagB/SpsB family)
LYAPTFREGEHIPYDNFIKNVNLEEYTLIIKGHPVRSGEYFDDRVFTCPEFSSLELLTVADYVITDYSAISIEASILMKPLYFYVYDYENYTDKNGLNLNLYEEMPGCVFGEIKELMHSIKHEEYDLSLVRNYRDKYIAHQEGTATNELAEYILGLRMENK